MKKQRAFGPGRARAENRRGKTGSHLLRAAFQEIELRADATASTVRVRAQPGKQDVKTGHTPSFAEICQPLLGAGTALQKQLMISACHDFVAKQQAEARGGSTEGLEDIIVQTCDKFLFTPSRPHSSLTAEASSLHVDRVTFSRDMAITAAATWQLGTLAWDINLQQMCRLIREELFEGIALVKHRVYDETPLKLRVRTSVSRTLETGPKADSCIAKVMQTRLKLGVLVREVSSGKYIFYRGVVPTILQALEKTRGEDIALSQARIMSSVPFLDSAYKHFKLHLDLTTADRCLANAKAERVLQSLRPTDVPLHIDCQVHKISTAVTWEMKVAEQHISGLISASLVLRQAGALARFREELFSEICSNLLVVHGPPREGSAKEFREQVYTMFLSATVTRPDDLSAVQKRRALQKAILNRFLCGDLTEATVEFYTGPIDATESQILRAIEKMVIPALCPGAMPTYARHRWLGGEQSVDFVGLIESHHRLFSRTLGQCLDNFYFVVWVSKYHHIMQQSPQNKDALFSSA